MRRDKIIVMSDHPAKAVENYTTPFLVCAFVLLFASLVLVWAAYGFVSALIVSAGLNMLIPAPRNQERQRFCGGPEL